MMCINTQTINNELPEKLTWPLTSNKGASQLADENIFFIQSITVRVRKQHGIK